MIARYRQKSASLSAICPSLLCVFVRRAICPSSISVAIPARKTSRANQDGVLTPPNNLPSRNEAPNPRSHVKLLATPAVGKSLPVPTCRFNPRCQKRSLCCHATQNRKPGSRRERRLWPVKNETGSKHCQCQHANQQRDACPGTFQRWVGPGCSTRHLPGTPEKMYPR